MNRQIRIKINPDGTIEARTIGITGKKCTEVIPLLEELLESRTQFSEYTEDYNLPETVTDTQVLKNKHHR